VKLFTHKMKTVNRDAVLAMILTKMNIKPQERPPMEVPPEIAEDEGPLIKERRPHEFSMDLNDLKPYLSARSNLEVEVGFGTFSGDGAFFPGLMGSFTFGQVMAKLTSDSRSFQVIHSKTLVEIDSHKIRKITNMETGRQLIQEKIRHKFIQPYDDQVFGFRISVSAENKHADPGYSFEPVMIRKRTRTEFLSSSTKSPFYGFKLDLTIVEEHDLVKDVKRLKYELELERVSRTAEHHIISPQQFFNAIRATLLLINAIDVSIPDSIITLQERQNVIDNFNERFVDEMEKKSKEGYKVAIGDYSLYRGFENKPRGLKPYNLTWYPMDFFVTVKLDGVRSFLFFDISGYCYIVVPPKGLFVFYKHSGKFTHTILDGEFVENKFIAFDILFMKGDDIRDIPFIERYHKMQEIFTLTINGDPLSKKGSNSLIAGGCEIDNVYLKRYHGVNKPDQTLRAPTGNDLYDVMPRILKEYKKFSDISDGIIFQRASTKYYNDVTFKWKPASLTTIDFYVEVKSLQEKEVFGEENEEEIILEDVFDEGEEPEEVKGGPVKGVKDEANYEIFLYIMDREQRKLFKGNARYPFAGSMFSDTDELDGEPINGRIVEFRWTDKGFQAIRFRDDRSAPNGLKPAEDTWMNIHEPMSEDTLLGKSLVAARSYLNHEIKERLIMRYARGVNLVDIGSGRGGDINKWNKAEVKHVTAVEPDRENEKILQERLSREKLKFGITVENTTFQKMTPESADLVTAFFCLNYVPESIATLSGFMKMIGKINPAMFIGVVMDGDRLYELTKEQLQTTAYEIERPKERKAVGSKVYIDLKDPDSMVKNQTEYLFEYDTFAGLMDKKGYVAETFFASELKNKLENRRFDGAYEVLPDISKRFVSLMRVMIFRRKDLVTPGVMTFKSQVIISLKKKDITYNDDGSIEFNLDDVKIKPGERTRIEIGKDPLLSLYLDWVEERQRYELFRDIDNGETYEDTDNAIKARRDGNNFFVSYIKLKKVGVDEAPPKVPEEMRSPKKRESTPKKSLEETMATLSISETPSRRSQSKEKSPEKEEKEVKESEKKKSSKKKCDIKFYDEDKKWGEFSNFYGKKQDKTFTLEIDGKEWKTTEHYFQAMKFGVDDKASLKYMEVIREANTPNIAKILANQKVEKGRYKWRNDLNKTIEKYLKKDVTIRDNWEEVKEKIMRKANKAKFSQNEKLKKLLLETGDCTLIEDSPTDEVWGIGKDGTGENKLGKILMRLRDEFRKAAE